MGRARSTLGVLAAVLLLVGGCESSVSPSVSHVMEHDTIVLNDKSLTLAVGQDKQLSTTGTSAQIAWQSDNPNVVAVSSTGMVSGRAPGTARVMVRSKFASDTSLVTVRSPIESVQFSADSIDITVGQSGTLAFRAFDAGGNELGDLDGAQVQWTSGAPAVATVDSVGHVSALAIGRAPIIVAVDGKLDTATVRVVPTPVVSVALIVPTPFVLTAGDTFRVSVTARDSAGNALANRVFSWASSSPAVATVSTSGLVSAVAAGTTTITATSGGKVGSASLTVAASQVVTAPTPTSPPSVDEPTYNPTTGALVFRDSMDEYTTPHDMWTSTSTAMRFRQAPWGEDVDSLTLITGRGGAGKALRMIYSGTYQDGKNWDLVNAPLLPDTTTHFYSYYARVTIAGPMPAGGLPVKWFMAWHPAGNRVEWDTHDYLPCSVASPAHTIWQVYDNGPTACQGNQPIGPYPDDVFDGQWHRYTYQYRPNTRAGSRDGVARMWVDGTKVIDISLAAAALVPAGGYKPWCSLDDIDALNNVGVSYLRFGGTLTKDTPPFTIDIDDFTWWYPD